MTYNKPNTKSILQPILKGVGQVLLQENSLSGLLILIGICCGSFLMGMAAIVGATVGTLTARLLNYNHDSMNAGLFGFSATLVGIALIYFYNSTIIIWALVIIGSVLATMLQHFFMSKKIPAFTFPFILVTWFLFVASNYFLHLKAAQPQVIPTLNYLSLFPLTFGQVILQGNIWAGIFFFASILIHQPIAAVYIMLSVVVSSVVAYLLGEPLNDIYMGLLSYNAVLCGIVFTGKKLEDISLATISVILSTLIMTQMKHMNLPALTFPFVLSTWIALFIKRIIHVNKQSVLQ